MVLFLLVTLIHFELLQFSSAHYRSKKWLTRVFMPMNTLVSLFMHHTMLQPRGNSRWKRSSAFSGKASTSARLMP